MAALDADLAAQAAEADKLKVLTGSYDYRTQGWRQTYKGRG